MNENIFNSYTISTVLIFLALFVLTAFFIRKKSSSLKKIINNKKINIIEYSPIRGGYSAIVFSVENEKFFFVGHKSGNSNLVQILQSEAKKDNRFVDNSNNIKNNDDVKIGLSEFKNKKVTPKIETKKPLEQVNISDLLALHKKG
tara:strand:- start:32 stop:466 length:435 start_codon:yes stop_codon:yes gene_type:complete